MTVSVFSEHVTGHKQELVSQLSLTEASFRTGP